MVNSNPETVSTDYDTSDLLFFEPLTTEDVLNIHDRIQPDGVIVQFGGQTPLNLARALANAGVPIIGTSVETIEAAEDREKFANILSRLGLKQPENGIARTMNQARTEATKVGFPALVRPSFVLGGRAMEICEATIAMAKHLRVIGLMNVQFAIKREDGKPVVYVLEVNPRASRTVPFVAKATGVPVAKIAAKVMAGMKLVELGLLGDPIPS